MSKILDWWMWFNDLDPSRQLELDFGEFEEAYQTKAKEQIQKPLGGEGMGTTPEEPSDV